MKNNHEKIKILIEQAIVLCTDDVLSETKSHLIVALKSSSEVSKKRKRHAATQKAIEEGKKKQQQWWDMIKKNVADNINLNQLDETD